MLFHFPLDKALLECGDADLARFQSLSKGWSLLGELYLKFGWCSIIHEKLSFLFFQKIILINPSQTIHKLLILSWIWSKIGIKKTFSFHVGHTFNWRKAEPCHFCLLFSYMKYAKCFLSTLSEHAVITLPNLSQLYSQRHAQFI